MKKADKDIIEIMQETIIGMVILEPGDKIKILKEMITVRVTLEDGDTFTTGINGTLQTAQKYYIGNYFNFGIEGDDMKKAIKVELV